MHLTLKIKDIPEAGLRIDAPLPEPMLKDALAGPIAVGADLSASHVEVHVDVSRAGDTISVRGRMAGDVKLPCTRCLAEAHVQVDLPLKVIVGPESMGAEDSLDDEIEYFNHDGEVVHLDTVLRESLILSLPTVALCRADCKGLCPVCGGDRNERQCDCQVEIAAPRFSALKDLKL